MNSLSYTHAGACTRDFNAIQRSRGKHRTAGGGGGNGSKQSSRCICILIELGTWMTTLPYSAADKQDVGIEYELEARAGGRVWFFER